MVEAIILLGSTYEGRTSVPALRGLMPSLVYGLPLQDCCKNCGKWPGPLLWPSVPRRYDPRRLNVRAISATRYARYGFGGKRDFCLGCDALRHFLGDVALECPHVT